MRTVYPLSSAVESLVLVLFSLPFLPSLPPSVPPFLLSFIFLPIAIHIGEDSKRKKNSLYNVLKLLNVG